MQVRCHDFLADHGVVGSRAGVVGKGAADDPVAISNAVGQMPKCVGRSDEAVLGAC
jgi:hypothetical protein